MTIKHIFYSLAKALQNIRHFLLINIITVGIIALSLIVLSTFLILFFNLRAYLDTWKRHLQVTAYLRDDALSSEKLIALQSSLQSLPEVGGVTFISKEEALGFLKQNFPDQAAALERLKNNPLPASIDIQLKEEYHDPQKIKEFAERVRNLSGVDEVEYGASWMEGYTRAVDFFKTAALTVGAVIVFATVFIISNTLRLTILARKDEIEVMRLVGATDSFIRTPFYIEGALQGFVGAVIALGVIYGCFHAFSNGIAQSSLFPLQVVRFSFLPAPYLLAVIVGGVLTGLVGSYCSLGRYFRI